MRSPIHNRAALAAHRMRRIAAGALLLVVPGVAAAQSTAGNAIDDGNYPPGFDCNSLGNTKARLDCQTVESNRTPDQDSVPPGTPAISMPGQPNAMPDANQHGTPPNNYTINNFIRGKGNSNR